MKKLLSLAFIALSLATATAFAESNTAPIEPTQTQETPAKGKNDKKHKKQSRKAHKRHHIKQAK